MAESSAITRRGFMRTFAGGALGGAMLHALPSLAQAQDVNGNDVVVPSDDEEFWDDLRNEFLIPAGETFCNTATLGAMPRRVLDVVTSSMREIEETLTHWDYRPEHPDWFAGYRPFEDVREPLARLIHCDVHELALAQNATVSLNYVGQGIDLQPGDEIVQTDQEHIGAKSTWEQRARRHGAVVRNVTIAVPPNDPQRIINDFDRVIGPKTRVLALPHQTSMLGLILPINEIIAIARAKGHPRLFVLLDGAQSVGQINVDMTAIDCDAYGFSPHKWLLAPPGSGALYIRRSRQEEIWTTLCSGEWANYETGAYRFMQTGTGNRSLYEGLKSAAEFRLWIGQERVSRRIKALGDTLRNGLQAIPRVVIHSSIHPAMASGITTYSVRGMTGPELMDAFWEKKYRVRSMGPEMGVRHSLHIYNSMRDVERALDIVSALAKRH